MVLSGNSLEHAVFEMAAMQARMPYVPVTPAYALLSQDHIKLQTMVEQINPAVIFVQSGVAFERALSALNLTACHVLQVEDAVTLPPGAIWSEALNTLHNARVETSIAAIQ